MSNDIRDIIRRLDMVEGRLSPAQQKVPQLPALFKPQHIRALGSKTDPAHPMDGYMVGDSAKPRRTALEEAMAEIEEDMLSKVRKDLTHYLDRLEKKVAVNRDLKDKAKDAVERGRVEEFAPVGGDDREPDEEEILRQLAAQWWNGTEQQMAKAQRTLAAMGWEIGQDESGDDDAGVFVVRAGDENGNSYMAFNHSDLDILDEAPPVPAAGTTPPKPGAPVPADATLTPAQQTKAQAVIDASGPAATQITQAGEKWQAGNKFGAVVDTAKAVNNVANAAGATFGDKLAVAGSAAKGAWNAGLAHLRGQDAGTAFAGSMASDLTQPVADYTNSKDFGPDFYNAMSAGGNPANPLQKAYDANLVNQDSVRTAVNSVNKTANQLKSGDASVMKNFEPPSLYRDDFGAYNEINKRNAITQKPIQTKAEIQADYPISGVKEEQGNDFNTYTTNAQGQRLQQSPQFVPGVRQTKNLDTGATTTDFNQGPMSASQTKNAAGATTAKAQSVDLGVAKFGTKQQQPNYAAGQLASPTVAKVSVPAGNATVTQKSYAGPMLGGASGPGVGNNVITKAAKVVPNANPAKSAVDPVATADATATANQLSRAAAPALNNQPGLQERSHPVETFEMSDGSCLECYGNDEQGYELRRQGNSLPSRFKTRKHAKMAVDLFRARRKQNQDLSQDYIEEK